MTSLPDELRISVQAATFREAGLVAVVINAETPERSDMWIRAGEDGPRILLLSPEQLISKRLEKLVNDSAFRRRVCLLIVDEVHLLDSWGNSFRKAYQQIQYVRARFESSTVALAMTATLLPGDQTHRVCEFVGLRNYHTVRRSNRRPEIQLLFRVLSHGIESREFPDLRWVIDDMQRKKIIIFCTSIRDGFRIYSYLWRQLDSPPNTRDEQLRMYNALNWPDYNLRTRELMRKQDGCRVIVATDILMVGIDFPDIDDVVIIGHPSHTNDYIQKIGHAGRDHALVSNPRGITYITTYTVTAAHEQLGSNKRPKRKNRTAKKRMMSGKGVSSKSSMSKPTAELIVSDCKTALLDRLYENSPVGELPRCNCSDCAPESETGKRPLRRRPKRDMGGLTKEMRESAAKRFATLRRNIFIKEAPSALTNPFFVLPRVLPDELVSEIIDGLLQLDYNMLNALVDDDEISKLHVMEIWTVAIELQVTFQEQLKQKKEEKAASKMYVSLSSTELLRETNHFWSSRSNRTKRKRELTDIDGENLRYASVPAFDMVPLTTFRLSDSQPDTKTKWRNIRPTRWVPPPTEQHSVGEPSGDEAIQPGSTAGDPMGRSAMSPLPHVIIIANFFIQSTPIGTLPLATVPTPQPGPKKLPGAAKRKQAISPIVPVRHQQARHCKRI